MRPFDAGRGPGAAGASRTATEPGSGRVVEGATPGTRTIGGVLAALAADFPDLTISKIRFLEAEGLVTPHRTGAGYRTYSDRDVERLRYILTAQRDRFWPLKVIRDALDAMDRGLQASEPDDPDARPRVPDPTADPDVPTATELAAPPVLRLTARELREAAGLDRSTLDALETYGLVRADSRGHFDDDALAVARVAVALAAYGVEPRHLRPFRTAADREIGLVQQIVRPARSAAGRLPRGEVPVPEDPTPEVLRLCVALHTALVRSGLRHG
ncbi:MAG TPA: MerR family transcriptional regulator [Lapillicoccus sp.]|nr:MerR family transcriptional regulator [Lapillicoccus sp.]